MFSTHSAHAATDIRTYVRMYTYMYMYIVGMFVQEEAVVSFPAKFANCREHFVYHRIAICTIEAVCIVWVKPTANGAASLDYMLFPQCVHT